MALTDAQRTQVRRYLGVSLIVRDAAWVEADTVLDTLDGLSDGGATEDHVVALLDALALIETQMTESRDLAMSRDAGGGVSVDYGRRIAVLGMEGRRLVGQLADVLQYPPRRDVFSGR